MLHGFDIVNDTLVYWHICEETYLSTPPSQNAEHHDLAKSLTKLYSLLIEYQALSIRHLSRRQLSRAWEKVAAGNEWADRIAHIEAENKRCREMIDPVKEQLIQAKVDDQLRVMQESQVILGQIREALEESKALSRSHHEDLLERALLHDLATDYEGYKNFNPRRVGGTCEWFFREGEFRKWRDGEEPGVLWVSAGPGCGKSVLARALVDEGRLSTRVATSTVCHFFFKKEEEGRASAASALSAIIHQLFTQNGERRELMDEALRRHRSYGKTLAANLSELWQILVHFARSPNAGEVVCVLDAFDECDEGDREALLEQIRGFYQQKNGVDHGNMRFFITSRPHDGLELALTQLSSVGALVHIDGDGLSREIGEEINLVIDARIPTITASFADKDRKRISDRLKSMKNRTYLWLHLNFDIIAKAPSRFGRARDLEDFLSKLSPEFSGAYENILSRSTDKRQTVTLLSIVVAAQRPLTLDEANIALALALDDTPASIDDLSPWPQNRFKTVVQSCGGLITVSDTKLWLISQTARDFLLSPKPSNTDGAWQGCLSLPEAHATMSHSCGQYLRLLANHTSANPLVYLDPEEYRTLQQHHPFLPYAVEHWPMHYLAAGDAAVPATDALSLCNPSNAHIWAPQHISRFLRWWAWSDLALASYIGLAPVVEDILSQQPPERRIDLDASCSDFGTALQTAAAGGHGSVVRVLLANGAGVNADVDGHAGARTNKGRCKGYGTPLQIAAARGHTAVVRLLLEHGADASLGGRGGRQGAALEAAKAGGHEKVVEILIKAALAGAEAASDPVEEDAKGDDNERDDAETPLIPGWFIYDADFEAATPRLGDAVGISKKAAAAGNEGKKAGEAREISPLEGAIGIEDSEEKVEVPLLPRWLDDVDYEVAPDRLEMPRWDSAHVLSWIDDDDEGVMMPSPTFVLPDSAPVTAPLRRAMALTHAAETDGSVGFTSVGEDKFRADHTNLSFPWLRT